MGPLLVGVTSFTMNTDWEGKEDRMGPLSVGVTSFTMKTDSGKARKIGWVHCQLESPD